MSLFTFIHAADLHLDSPFVGLAQLPHGQAHVVETLREATFKAFEAVIRICLDRQVDFLLVAGDIYDGADRSLRAQLRFRDGLRRLSEAGIRAFIINGNHDPLDGWAASLRMPAGVQVFGPQRESVSFFKNGEAVARIHGISYPSKKIGKGFGQGFQREGEEPFQIGLFHCHAGPDTTHERYAPRTVEELAETGLDYWALGHIHKKQILSPSHPFIGYPGNTQGRHINESGARGCFLVSVSAEGQMESLPEFLDTDIVRWLSAEVDISGLDFEDDLLVRLEQKIETLSEQANGRAVIGHLSLFGRGPLHHLLLQSSFYHDLLKSLREFGTSRNPFIWIEKLQIQTRPDIDLESLRKDQNFLGDLLRLTEEIRNSPEQLAELQSVLSELYSHSRAERHLESLKEVDLSLLLDEAENRCLDLLAEEDE